MDKHMLPLSAVLKGPSNEVEEIALRNAVDDIAQQAEAHLQRARELNSSGLPSNAHYALYPAIGCSQYLDRLRRNGCSPLIIEDGSRVLKLQFGLLKMKFTGRF